MYTKFDNNPSRGFWVIALTPLRAAGGGRLRRKTITSPDPSDTGDIISNHMSSKVQSGITYPFTNFNSCAGEVWEWISNFSTLYNGCNYSPMVGFTLIHVSKQGHWNLIHLGQDKMTDNIFKSIKICITYNFSSPRWGRYLKSFLVEDKNLFVLHDENQAVQETGHQQLC